MKFKTKMAGFSICVAAAWIQAGPALAGTEPAHPGWASVQASAGGDASTSLGATASAKQRAPVTVAAQADDNSKDGNTPRLVLLALLVMGSIALRRSRPAQ